MAEKIRVTVWNEGRHEKENKKIAELYPQGIHGAIAADLEKSAELEVRTATLDDPDQGLPDAVLQTTDVLIWWGHRAHREVQDALVEKIQLRILSGMGLIVLHSGHYSKIFKRMMGTYCSLKWRDIGEKERLWNLAPGHPVTAGIGDYFEIPKEEMYGERFDIPEPDQLIFVSWFAGGEVFRSGCTWERGQGRIFYFRPGHESYPTYHDSNVLKVIGNAVRWAKPRVWMGTQDSPNVPKPLENLALSKK